jgi:hypothetical protein
VDLYQRLAVGAEAPPTKVRSQVPDAP